jgi:hypothetical protein
MFLHLSAGAQVLRMVCGNISATISRGKVASMQHKRSDTIWNQIYSTLSIFQQRNFPFGMSATHEVALFEPERVDHAASGAFLMSSLM